ncbi:MAG: hypothetical protein AAGD11_13675 [Planctomycetota bacterium]
MKALRKLVLSTAAIALLANTSSANELLQGGDFEDAGSGIPGWVLEESIFDQTTMTDRDFGNIDTAQQIGFGPNQGALDLWLRPFAGGDTLGPDNLTNAVLSQTVPVTPSTEYTFSGHTRYEVNFGGGVTTLSSMSPLGTVAPPTETTFELAFLNSGGSVIGSPLVLDVNADRITQIGFPDPNDDGWYQHVLTQTAPASAVSARVTAASRKMVFNQDPNQSAFFDTFSFTDTNDPSTELLENDDLEEEPSEFGAQWVVTEVEGGNLPGEAVLESRGFANRPDSGGSLGVWLKPFVGDAAQPADGFLTQTVPGVEGGEYTFNGWARWEANYSGGDPSFNTETFMELAFLDGTGSEIGSPIALDLSTTAQANGGPWLDHTLTGTAPAGTVEVRVSAGALGMEDNPLGGQQSAFFDDFSLMLASSGTDADADGDVDGADFLLLQQNDPSLIPQWQIDYGSGNLLASQSVPEPTSLVSAAIGLSLFALRRSRQ